MDGKQIRYGDDGFKEIDVVVSENKKLTITMATGYADFVEEQRKIPELNMSNFIKKCYEYAQAQDFPDENFGKLFTDIWLAESTSQPELRKALLGLSN